MNIAIVHDYLTQSGGAERVVLSMLKAWPGVPIHTSMYEPESTFPQFRNADVHTLGLNRLSLFRKYHRAALPLLAPAFSRLTVDAVVTICSSSGWAHGVNARGRKVVYCYTPARWLYQANRYLRGRSSAEGIAMRALMPHLHRWDRRAAATAHRYITLSTAVRERIRVLYGMDAEVLPPPHTIDPTAPADEIWGLEPGFHLCVSRLLPYKNVDAIVQAFSELPEEQLVIAGTGPEERRLRGRATPNVRFLGRVADEQLRWLYRNCSSVIAASYEDYGLTPLEGAAFGKPAAVLRWGGFLDTLAEGTTGLFFDQPHPVSIRQAVKRLTRDTWRAKVIKAHADRYAEHRFIRRIREIVIEESGNP